MGNKKLDENHYEVIEEKKVIYTLEEIQQKIDFLDNEIANQKNKKDKWMALKNEMIAAGVK